MKTKTILIASTLGLLAFTAILGGCTHNVVANQNAGRSYMIATSAAYAQCYAIGWKSTECQDEELDGGN